MQSFQQWASQLHGLAETYYGIDPAEYDRLFDEELERLLQRLHVPAHWNAANRMRDFAWTAYVAAALRGAGFHDYRDVQEKTHDIVTTLLTGKLFTGYDETRHGEFDRRFKAAVSNAVRNLVAKERNRRHYLPAVSIGQSFEPGGVTADELPDRPHTPDDDEKLIHGFCELVRRRLGGLGVAVLQVRLDGGEVKSLVGCKALGSPGKWTIKRVVGEIKALAREYARSLGDSELLRRIEKAMAAESDTIQRRQASSRARQAVGLSS